MSELRKKPGVAFWATVVVVCLPIAYVLSFGPACWLVAKEYLGTDTIWRMYRPIARLVSDPDDSIAKRAVCQWVSICRGEFGLAVLQLTFDPADPLPPTSIFEVR